MFLTLALIPPRRVQRQHRDRQGLYRKSRVAREIRGRCRARPYGLLAPPV